MLQYYVFFCVPISKLLANLILTTREDGADFIMNLHRFIFYMKGLILMSEYKLQIKQVVDYPRCRIYRQLIQYLIKDPNIRIGGSSGLFYYTVLCCYANFRTSYKRIDGISYTVYPGEWICRISEFKEYWRCKTIKQVMEIFNDLRDRYLITYCLLGRGKLIKFRVKNWCKTNRVLDYNAPCQKETGFFFLPISVANELVSFGKCSEMDAMLDLWINTIYNDEQVKGSDVGPIVYIRNGTGNPLLSCEELAQRWGISKSTVSRYLNKLKTEDYIMTVNFQGTHGTAIYVKRYLSTMFEISDVLIDKQELAMALNIDIKVPDSIDNYEEELPDNISVSKELNSVSKIALKILVEKMGKILSLQGFPCPLCPKIQYKLLPLSECKETSITLVKVSNMKKVRFLLCLSCSDSEIFRFDITMREECSE